MTYKKGRELTKEKEAHLLATYAEIFSEMPRPGLPVGDGWYSLLELLCRELIHPRNILAQQMETCKECIVSGKGLEGMWTPQVLETLTNAHAAAIASIPKAQQVKEKFGGLRFYVLGGDARAHGLISFAEALSYRTCEECGNVGKQVECWGWQTLCDPCHTEQLTQKSVADQERTERLGK